MPAPIRSDDRAAAPDEVLAALAASRGGLATSEVEYRRAAVAAAVSAITGGWASVTIILGIVAVSGALDVTQKHRAEAVAEARRDGATMTATPRPSAGQRVVTGWRSSSATRDRSAASSARMTASCSPTGSSSGCVSP